MEIICGTHAVLEILRAGKRKCREVFIAEGRKEKVVSEIEEAAKKRKVPVKQLRFEENESLARLESHQGVAVRCGPFVFSSLQDVIKAADPSGNKGFIIILDGILDPHNLGSLIRTANLCGVNGMILPKDNSAPVGPAATKVSSGATEHLPIVQVTNVVSTIKELKEAGFWVVGAAGEGAQNVYLFDFTGNNYVLVLGSEGKGIRRLVRENCDHLVFIPMLGKIESYNVSVAGAIFMSEIMRQRHFKTL